jgi:hypothetical protein
MAGKLSRVASETRVFARRGGMRLSEGVPAIQMEPAHRVAQLIVDNDRGILTFRKVLDMGDGVEDRGKPLAPLFFIFASKNEGMVLRVKTVGVVTAHIQCMRISSDRRMYRDREPTFGYNVNFYIRGSYVYLTL